MINLMKPPIEYRNGYKNEEHREKVRDLPCLACELKNMRQEEPTEGHHLIGYGGGKKPTDYFMIPLCNKHHVGNFRTDGKGNAIHKTVLRDWEVKFAIQEILLERTFERIDPERWVEVRKYINRK